MQNMVQDLTGSIETLEQINEVGMSSHLIAIMAVSCVVVPIVIHGIWKIIGFYKDLNNLIDKRIEAKTQGFVELLKDTVEVVKNLERNTAEMSATLSVLKELLLSMKKS